ncbi:MAG: cell wall metabolism sensor histidine kinase WalK, partial [Bacteroidota bacterium]|nr:cell wall metabolism sensor histidine kinase WalK [Bacteroidota bacterium]MDX5430483.1 cell wall metabolism sensor histidine kinase WalK [Bacteroidota bacterium]MDX5469244.1 cell wall metabolism sensor histidine kinase WalK [Bacteroidota bacterium]
MKWGFTDFSIKTRIQLGVSAFLLVIAVLGSASIYYLREIQKNAESIFTRNYVILEKSQRLNQYAFDFRVNWLNFTNGNMGNQDAIGLLYSNLYDLDSVLINQKHLAKGEVEPARMDSVQQALDQLKLDFKQIRFVGRFDTAGVSETIYRDLDAMLAINDRFSETMRKDVLSRYDRTKSTVNQVITIMVALTISLSVLGFILLWLIPGYIVGPLNELAVRITRIGDKDFSQRMKGLNKSDEFGALASAFNRMANQLDEYKQMNITEMLKEKQRTEAIIDNLNEAILVTDESDELIWMNEQAETLLGLPRKAILGMPLKEIRPVNFSNEVFLSKPGDSGASLFNFSAIIGDRTKYFHKEEVKVGALSGNGMKESAGKVIIFYDITDFRELDMAKTNFMATLSHQFKTPISAMNISLNLLNNPKVGELNEEQKSLIQTLQAQNERLLSMVNELLDLGQIETGKIRLVKEEITADELVSHSISTIKAILESRALKVVKEIDPALPSLEVDLEKITWVLNNLLT